MFKNKLKESEDKLKESDDEIEHLWELIEKSKQREINN